MNTKSHLLKVSFVTIFAVSTQMLPAIAQAEIITLAPHAKVITKANTPKHGQTMQVVTNKFGKAKHVNTSKGPVTKQNPRITRWDYTEFSVYFENSHVIHSVIHR